MTSKKKKLMTRIVCGLLAFGIILGAGASLVNAATIEYTDKEGSTHKLEDFRDTRGHWAQQTLKKWAEYEIIAGDNGNFKPNEPITRADLAVVIDRLLGLEEISYHYFQDLPGNTYYRDSMLRTVAAGYIMGTSENTLNPKGYATREEVATILSRVYKLDTIVSKGVTPIFTDSGTISTWAKQNVEVMAAEGYLNGFDGKVRPKDRITRAEVIVLLSNIADAYVPKRDVHGTGMEYKNDLSNNVVVARNITLNDSNLSKDVVLTPSGKMINLERVTIGRRLVALGTATINLNNVKVPVIELYGRGTVNGMEENKTEVKIMNQKSSSTRIDALPTKITLAPETFVIIENERFENNTDQIKVITYKEIVEERADRLGYVAGGPIVSTVKIGQDLNNNVEIKDLKVVEGNSEIVEVGVIEVDKGKRPTIKNNTGIYKHTSKEEYTSLGEYNFTAGKVKATKEYRVYVKDKNGLYGYSDVVSIGEYKFGTDFKVKVGAGTLEVDIELEITGDNMPEVRNIEVLYSDKEASEGYKKQALTEKVLQDQTEAEKEKNKKKKVYTGTVKVTEAEMIRDYGYIITYGDGNTQKAYPVKKGFNPNNYERKYNLTTGALVEKGREAVEIQGNTITTENTAIRDYGIIYKIQTKGNTIPTEVGKDSSWRRQGTSKVLKEGNTDTYNSKIGINVQGVEVYYASYAVIDGKEVYGELKSHTHDWSGDIDGPELQNIKVSHLGTFAVIEIKLPGDILIDPNSKDVITNLRGSDGNLISNIVGKSLTELKATIVQDLWGTKSITILIIEPTLAGKGVITGELRLTSVEGNKSGKYSISMTPENEIKFMPVGREGNKVTYSVADEKYVGVIEFKKVISGTNMVDTGIYEDGKKLTVTKENPGTASILTVELDYYIARSIGNVVKETIITNITLP